MKICYAILILFAFASCDPEDTSSPEGDVQGFVPVYGSSAEARLIRSEPARPTVRAGKMYTTGNYLFQVEQDSGIHVINYADPAHPQKLGFIRSVLCKEVAVKNGRIYTNNLSDLVVIDVSNINQVAVVSRTENVFPELSRQYPARPGTGERVYFECPDPDRGFIVSWKPATINKPKCWR